MGECLGFHLTCKESLKKERESAYLETVETVQLRPDIDDIRPNIGHIRPDLNERRPDVWPSPF